MSNRGKAFEGEFRRSLEHVGIYVIRIADKLYWNGQRLVSQETPADFLAYVHNDGLSVMMIECKATAQKSIRFDAVQPHQKKALCEFDMMHHDAHGYVVVNFYGASNLKRSNRCFMIPVDVWCEYEKASDRKSLSIASCEEDERIIELKRIKGSLYDAADLLKK